MCFFLFFGGEHLHLRILLTVFRPFSVCSCRNTLLLSYDGKGGENDLIFHLKSVKLLALCAKNRNSNTGAKCQNFVSLRAISEELQLACQKMDSSVDVLTLNNLKSSLLQFAHYVYCDTPLVESELTQSNEMWSLLVLASKEAVEAWKKIEQKSSSEKIRMDEEEIVLSSLGLLHCFFTTLYSEIMTGSRIIKAMDRIKNDMKLIGNSRYAQSSSDEFVTKAANFAGKIFAQVVSDGDKNHEIGLFRPASSTKLNASADSALHLADEVSSEGIEMTPESEDVKTLLGNDKQKYLTKVMTVLKNSKCTQEALKKKDDEFLEVLENVENLTDPENPEWVEVLTGHHIDSLKNEKIDRAKVLLDFLQGSKMLVFVLTLVLIAACATIVGMALDSDVQILVDIEFVISIFFMVELTLRIGAYMKVHGELDSFVMDPLNDIDVLVVLVDVLLMVSAGEAEGDAGGLVKSLRGARGFRLLRLFRAARVMRLTKKADKMSKTMAENDPRSKKITFGDLCTRMVKYVDNHCESTNVADLDEKHSLVIGMIFDIMTTHLRRYKNRKDNVVASEVELLEFTEDELEEARKEEYLSKQHSMLKANVVPVIVRVLSVSKMNTICHGALELGAECLADGNKKVQAAFKDVLDRGDKEGMFFLSMRDRIRNSAKSLVEYRTIREFNASRAEECVKEVRESVRTQKLMTELCEGHNLSMQNLIREQTHNLKTFNLLEENTELLSVQAKNLTVVRQFNELEAEVTLSTLEFMVEVVQGPCKENQDFLANSRKPVDVCKNILSSNFHKLSRADPLAKWRLWRNSLQLIAGLMESRIDDVEIHDMMGEQIPAKMLLDARIRVNTTNTLLKNGVLDSELDDEQSSELSDCLEDMSRCIFTIANELRHHTNDANDFAGVIEIDEDADEEEKEEEKEEEEGEQFGDNDDGSSAKGFGTDATATAAERKKAALQEKRKKLEAAAPKVDPDVRSVEVFWNGKCVKTYFTLPKEWHCFSSLAKQTFEDGADLSNAESRMKCLIDLSEDLYEEMRYQYYLSHRSIYRFFTKYYFSFKSTLYAVVILLNLNVMFSTFDSLENTSIFDDLGKTLTPSENITSALALVILAGYSSIVVYNGLSYAPLCISRSKRQQRDLRKAGKANSESSCDIWVVFWWIALLSFYTAFCYIHSTTIKPYKSTDYVYYGVFLSYLTAPIVLRKFLLFPKSKVMQGYCALYDTICFSPIRNHLVLIGVVLSGFYRSYWFTFALLDIVSMSKTLDKVILSVTIPFNQLMQTFALFIIVICCYTSIAYKAFGPLSFVDGDDDDAPNACTSLIDCFIFSVYVGMKEGDMGAVLSDVELGDPGMFRSRMIYDLTFFIILGVLLFDMVTGIILDTFGALREEVAEREDKMNNETFVSGLTRAEIEELEGNAIDFNALNDVHQNRWDYLFFVIYLRNKPPDELNGVESFVRDKLDNEEVTAWLPSRTSVDVEHHGKDVNDERDESEKIGEQVDRLVQLEENLKVIVGKIGGGGSEI